MSCRPREQCSGAIMTMPGLDDFKPKNRASVRKIAIDRRQHGAFGEHLTLGGGRVLTGGTQCPGFLNAGTFLGKLSVRLVNCHSNGTTPSSQ